MAYTISATVDVSLASKCELLKKNGTLSKVINKLLMSYFASQEDQYLEGVPILLTVRHNKDIDRYLEIIKGKAPNISDDGIKKLKENLIAELKVGEFVINTETGERVKVIKIY